MKKRHVEVLQLSGITGEGLQAVLDACAKVLYSKTPPKPAMRTRAPKSLSAKVKAKLEAKAVAASKAGKVHKRKPVPSRLKAKDALKRGARGRKR
jgi:hypothetical protein